MTGPSAGCLAIWVDIDAEDETDYVHWLTREHMPERLSVPGMRAARFFRSLARPQSHFMIVYETDSRAVLSSGPYLDILNNPSDWTRRIMPRLRNVVRGAAQRTALVGAGGTGGTVGVTRLADEANLRGDAPARRRDLLSQAASCDRIARVSSYESDAAATGIATNEKRMRARDDASFRHLVLVEGADERAVDAAQGVLSELIDRPDDAFRHTYGLAHLLDN